MIRFGSIAWSSVSQRQAAGGVAIDTGFGWLPGGLTVAAIVDDQDIQFQITEYPKTVESM